MYFEIDYQDHCDRDEERFSDDAYDYSWREDHSYYYRGAREVAAGSYRDVALFPGEEYTASTTDLFLVLVSYNTGDSFGHGSGLHSHLWLFVDRGRAERLAAMIELDAAGNPDYDFNHTPMKFDDVPINTNEWKGYFESFNTVEVERLPVLRRRTKG